MITGLYIIQIEGSGEIGDDILIRVFGGFDLEDADLQELLKEESMLVGKEGALTLKT